MMKRRLTKIATTLLTLALAFTTVPVMVPEMNNVSVVKAAETNIITGGEGTVTTVLSTKESATVTLNDCAMTVRVGTSSWQFANGSKVVGIAKIADDDLLHFFTLSGKYYCVDLRYGSFTMIEAYRNTSSGKYVRAKSAGSYEVFGSSMIPNSPYFYERLSVNSTSRELLISRADFESIVNPSTNPNPTVNQYTVKFQDWDGSILSTQTVEEGKSATAPANPSRNGYTFTGWDKALTNITSDLIVTAQYSKNAAKYTVTFKDWDGSVLKAETVEEGHNAMPPANPTRSGYTFTGWDKPYINVTADTVVTAVYQQTPPNSSTSSTNGTADTKVKFDIDFWWQQYTQGKITWDEFMQAAAQFQWTSKSVTDNASHTTTYYFYDANGVLQRTESVTTGQSTTNNAGQGTATATAETQGTANVDLTTNGQGGATGTAEAHTEYHSTTTTTNNSSSAATTTKKTTKKKEVWLEYVTSKKTYLRKVKNGVVSTATTVSFNKKKGIVKWNDKTYKDVKDVGFTSKSRQIILLKKDGTAYILARAKGKDGKVYTDRKLSGKWNSIKREQNTRLAIRLAKKNGKTKGIQNLQPKVKADKKATTKSK